MRDAYSRKENEARTTVHKWRAIPQEEIDAIDSFLNWLEDSELLEEEVKTINKLANLYLGRDKLTKDIIKASEQSLLEKWRQSNE